MKTNIENFENIQEILRKDYAPVFVRRNFRTGKVTFLRKPSCTPAQVLAYWLENDALKKLNEPSTNNQRTVNE